MDKSKIEIATKYQVDSDNKLSNYTKQGSNNGINTKETIIKALQQQSKKKGK